MKNVRFSRISLLLSVVSIGRFLVAFLFVFVAVLHIVVEAFHEFFGY